MNFIILIIKRDQKMSLKEMLKFGEIYVEII